MIIRKYSNEKNKFNIFLALLRVYLSFDIVTSHCLNPSKFILKYKYLKLLIKNDFHVPIFFIMSFYLCQNLFSLKNIRKIKQRFERLIIPYLIWPIIIFIINNYIIQLNLDTSFNNLKRQLITGHCFMRVLWFQYDLIFTTLLFTICEFFFFKMSFFLLINLFIFSYFFQYSKLNYEIFKIYSISLKYPLGRFLEILPFSVTGYIIAFFEIKIFLIKYRKITLYLLLLLFIFIIKFQILINIKGFGYQGFYLLIASSIIFLKALILPLEKVSNKCIINIIKLIANKTTGIYFLHIIVYNYLKKFIKLIKYRTFYGCIIIYIISYFICCLGIKLLGKTKFRNLFQ